MELKGRNAVITGGAMGIGLATATRLVKAGCGVCLWDINAEALAKAKAELEALGGKVVTHVCDVTDKERVYETARQTIQEVEHVDILINNAGYVSGGDLLERPDTDWERTIDINLTALVYMIRAFLPGMYKRNLGHIVNISSAAGTLGVPGLAVYCATKWAVWGLTESLRFEALERGKPGVRYSSIHPSYLAHGMFEGAQLKGLGKLIVPLVKSHDDVARLIVERAIRKGRFSPKIPWTVHLTVRLRGILPDSVFQRILMLLGVPGSMAQWKGRQ